MGKLAVHSYGSNASFPARTNENGVTPVVVLPAWSNTRWTPSFLFDFYSPHVY